MSARTCTYDDAPLLPVLRKPIMCSRYMVMKLPECRPRQIEFESGDKLFSLRPPFNGTLRQLRVVRAFNAVRSNQSDTFRETVVDRSRRDGRR